VQAPLRDGDPSRSIDAPRPLVLVAVAEARLASFLDRVLTAAGYQVVCAQNVGVALEYAKPDVVLLDPLDSKTDCVRARTNAPIVVFSTDASVDSRVAALEAGADDVMLLPFENRDLLARLAALRRGRALAAASAAARARHGTLSYADVDLNLDTREVWRGGRKIELRHKAFELLACFMRHPRRVLSRRELLEEVWGYDFLGDSNVIEVTVSAIRQALEAGGEPRLIFTVRPIGYILNARLKVLSPAESPPGPASDPAR
jgi:two-component system, OmpR family, response regulator MprA